MWPLGLANAGLKRSLSGFALLLCTTANGDGIGPGASLPACPTSGGGVVIDGEPANRSTYLWSDERQDVWTLVERRITRSGCTETITEKNIAELRLPARKHGEWVLSCSECKDDKGVKKGPFVVITDNPFLGPVKQAWRIDLAKHSFEPVEGLRDCRPL